MIFPEGVHQQPQILNTKILEQNKDFFFLQNPHYDFNAAEDHILVPIL